MRRQCKSIDRAVLGGLVDAPHQFIACFESPFLARDKAERRYFALRQEAKRFKAADNVGVVLEQEAIDPQPVEQAFGQPIVMAWAVMPGHAAAAAYMHRDGYGIAAHGIVTFILRSRTWCVSPSCAEEP